MFRRGNQSGTALKRKQEKKDSPSASSFSRFDLTAVSSNRSFSPALEDPESAMAISSSSSSGRTSIALCSDRVWRRFVASPCLCFLVAGPPFVRLVSTPQNDSGGGGRLSRSSSSSGEGEGDAAAFEFRFCRGLARVVESATFFEARLAPAAGVVAATVLRAFVWEDELWSEMVVCSVLADTLRPRRCPKSLRSSESSEATFCLLFLAAGWLGSARDLERGGGDWPCQPFSRARARRVAPLSAI